MRCRCTIPENFVTFTVHTVHDQGHQHRNLWTVNNFTVLYCPCYCPYFYTLLTVLEAPPKSCIMDSMDGNVGVAGVHLLPPGCGGALLIR